MEEIFKRLKKIQKAIPEEIQRKYCATGASSSGSNSNSTYGNEPGPSNPEPGPREPEQSKRKLAQQSATDYATDDDGFDSGRTSSPGSNNSTPPPSPDFMGSTSRPQIKVENNQSHQPRILTLRARILRLEQIGDQHDQAVLEICNSVLELEKKAEQFDLAFLQTSIQSVDQENIIQLYKNKMDEINQRLIIMEEREANGPTRRRAAANQDGYLCTTCNKRYANKYYLPFHSCRPQTSSSSASAAATGPSRKIRRNK